jgi:hypothetical protein
MLSQEFPHIPASLEYLTQLFQQLFLRLAQGQSATVTTFSGSGKWSLIKYVLQHIRSFDQQCPKTLFLPLRVNNLLYSPAEEIQNGIAFMVAKASLHGYTIPQQLLQQTAEMHSLPECSSLLGTLTGEAGYKVVLIIDGAENLTSSDRSEKMLLSMLYTLITVNVFAISMLFITKGESAATPESLGPLSRYYFQKIIAEQDIPFDKASIQSALNTIELDQHIKLSQRVKETIATVSNGDAQVLKLITNGIQKKSLLDALDATQYLLSRIYQELDEKLLDAHFFAVLNRLSPASRDYLFDKQGTPTQYLIDANLINTVGGFINPLFEYYINNRTERFLLASGSVKFAPQEELLVKYLVDSIGTVLSREQIAKIVWGVNYTAKYSDQAIDRLLSNIRTKIIETPYALTVLKRQGIRLDKK